jgi:hypothetical protein
LSKLPKYRMLLPSIRTYIGLWTGNPH